MPKPQNNNDLFKRLTRLFRSGPIVKRKVRTIDTTVALPDKTRSSAVSLFQRSLSPTYTHITNNAYNMQERMSRYQDFNEMTMCVISSTLIAVPGGFKTIKELADEYGLDKPFIVYSYNHELKRIVPAWAKQARQTFTDMAYEVKFDDGKSITANATHRLMLRDASYKTVAELKPGDAMMPFKRNQVDDSAEFLKNDGEKFLFRNDPSVKHSITFPNIIQWCDNNGYNKELICNVLGISLQSLGDRLCENGFKDFETFKNAYNLNRDEQIIELEDNCKVVSITPVGVMDLYDLTVDGYKNFATDSIISHNTAEISTALDIYCLAANNHILLSDGSAPTIGELYNAGIHDFSVLSYDTNTNLFTNAICAGVVKTGKGQQIYKVTLKNGRVLRLTDKHLVYTKYSKRNIFGKARNVQNFWLRVRELKEKEAHVLCGGVQRNKSGAVRFVDESFEVMSVEPDGIEDVYDLNVKEFHTFLISDIGNSDSWAVVHNSDESVAQDDKGRSLHVYSNNPKIKETLEELFYNTLNCEFNLRMWVRNLVKYGDFLLYNDVSPQNGVINAIPIPVNEIEREEGYDREDPMAVRFRWVTLGNRILENWEVTHMRLLGDDMFLPYGCSVLEGARRIWRQLILVEDAMLVYRITRAPERRVFYVDTGNAPTDEIPHILRAAQDTLRTQSVVDQATGRVDLRYNSMSVSQDYFVAVRGRETGTKIDTLAGGQNTAAVEDVQYIQRKLFSALKVPKAYLGFDDALSSKATLSAEDIRFSRSIGIIQRTIISELNKLAIIHLYACGWTGEDLLNFTLRLSNPSTVAQQQKLELYRTKFEICSAVPEGILSRDYIRRNVLGMTDEEIKQVERELINDAKTKAALEVAGMGASTTSEGLGGGPGPGQTLPGPGASGGLGGGEVPTAAPEKAPGAAPGALVASEFNDGQLITAQERIVDDVSGDDQIEENSDDIYGPSDKKQKEDEEKDKEIKYDDDGTPVFSVKDDKSPVRVQNYIDRHLYNRARKRNHGASKTGFFGNDKKKDDPYDMASLRSLITNPLADGLDRDLLTGQDFETEAEEQERQENERDSSEYDKLPAKEVIRPVISKDIMRMFDKMDERFGMARNSKTLVETVMQDGEEIIIDISDPDENINNSSDDDNNDE
jgi:hypothetical protein